MGCDIHMYVEYRKSVNSNFIWVNGDHFKMNPYFGDPGEAQFERIELHGNRNYALFTTLCGVQDYSEKTIPVSDPKGIPEDCCQYVKSECERWDGDGHTHSWATLKELREYQQKGHKLKYSGLISQKQIADLNNGITPNSWCQGTNAVGYERREWEEENTVLNPLIAKMQKRAHELMQWDWEEYDAANDDKIRIVFWFDN